MKFIEHSDNILARDPLPDVKEAFNVVSREESRRGLHPKTGSESGNKVQPAAFVNPNQQDMGNSFGNSYRKVYNNNTEAPKGTSTSSGSTSFDTQFTKEQMRKILSLINDKPCYIHDLNLVKTLGTGCKADGLYLFDVDQIGKSVVGCANFAFVCHVSKQLWRSRLGHPADHVLSVLIPELNLLNFFDNSNDPAPKVPNDDEREHSTGDGNVMASHDVNSSHHVDENATFATPLNENNSSSEGQQSDPIPPRFNSEYLSTRQLREEPTDSRRVSTEL
ncbi:hypothetical protein Tco_0687901 [Tanacetum coccineum]